MPYLAIAIGCQGPYFNFISDNFKHKYVYVGGDAIMNLNTLLVENNKDLWKMHVFAGSGLLYNDFFKKTNFCIHGGLINELEISNKMSVKLKVSAIIWHSIYQKDKDILPNLSLGLTKHY